jgi:hypothetical protein
MSVTQNHEENEKIVMEKWLQKLVKGSIRKWENVLYKNKEERGAADCPLCAKFNVERSGRCCVTTERPPYTLKCPVYEKTGEKVCTGTPYEDWEDFELENDRGELYHPTRIVNKNPTQTDIALRMVNFLKSLLPEDKKVEGDD